MPRKCQPRIRVCEFCSHLIGPDRGPAAKTCSEECQRDRNNAKEKARYQRVKNTQEWKETRSAYIVQQKERAARDHEYAKRLAKQRRAAVRKHRASLSPEQLEALREKGRQWHRNMTPEQRAARKYWYGGLSPELKQVFLLELRERRAQKKNERKQPMTDPPTPAAIRAAREAACLTQTQAATLVHSGLRAWQKWESGERRMDGAHWELFCIKIGRDDLFQGTTVAARSAS